MHQQQQFPAAVYSQVNMALTIQQGTQSNYQQQPNAQIHQQQRQMLSQLIQQLSWQCRGHFGNMSVTRQKVAKFGSTCLSVPTQKVH
jgi:hypothetical protein